jgi:para-nitrobenzyl esterase
MQMCAQIIVETKSGKLEGMFEKNLNTFKGVPYAAPPIGEFRWRAPQPINPWKGIRPALAYGAISPQNAMSLPGLASEPEVNGEDCLFLNVYSPGVDNARRPVMVWIHGGAFSIGSGSEQMFRNSTLVSKNIVLVTLNYRLGALGFLNLNELTRGKIPSTGNEGLLDQIAALEWVKENIASFGGDPDNVTIFGESAGAMSIGCLLNIPKARGLFHKAILESPVGEMARPLDASVDKTEVFLDVLGLKADDVSLLRSLPVEKMLRAQVETAIRTEQGAAPFVPAADGVIMPRMPLESMEAGMGIKVPTLIGSNLDEDKLFSMMNPGLYKMNEEGLRRSVSKYVAEKDVERLIDVYRATKEKRGEPVTPFELYSAISTDVMFRKTAIRIAEAQCKFAPGGYNYLFCWKSLALNGKLGACHALEIGFVFGNYDAAFGGSGPEADNLSGRMQDAWVSFARSGNPSCASLGEWPKYSDQRAAMIFDRDCRVEIATYEEERAVWETVEELKYSNMP